MEVELVLVRNLEGAVVALFASGMLRLHVALQVLFKLPARVADAANGFHDGLGLLTWVVNCYSVTSRNFRTFYILRRQFPY